MKSDEEFEEECTINGELDVVKYIRALIDRGFPAKLSDYIIDKKNNL